MKWEDMRTRDLQSALRKRGVDPSKFVMREEILAAIREATRGEEAAAAAHAATVGAALRRRVLLENLWLAAKWGSVALFVLFASTAGRPWIEGQYAQLTWWLATKRRYFAKAWKLRSFWGAAGLTVLALLEASMAHMSASVLASWVLPRGSPLRKFMFPILPLTLDPAALLAATATPGAGGVHGSSSSSSSSSGGALGGMGFGLNVGAMVQGWLMRKAHATIERWTVKRLEEAVEWKRARRKQRKYEEMLRRGPPPDDEDSHGGGGGGSWAAGGTGHGNDDDEVDFVADDADFEKID